MAKFRRRDDGGDVLGLFQRRRGEVMRQMKLSNGDFDVDAEVILTAQNLNDAAARVLCGRGPVGDFDIYDYTFEIVPF